MNLNNHLNRPLATFNIGLSSFGKLVGVSDHVVTQLKVKQFQIYGFDDLRVFSKRVQILKHQHIAISKTMTLYPCSYINHTRCTTMPSAGVVDIGDKTCFEIKILKNQHVSSYSF